MSDRLNLEDDGVEFVEITVEQARDSEKFLEAIESALDQAQGFAFGGDGDAHLVIKIKKNV